MRPAVIFMVLLCSTVAMPQSGHSYYKQMLEARNAGLAEADFACFGDGETGESFFTITRSESIQAGLREEIAKLPKKSRKALAVPYLQIRVFRKDDISGAPVFFDKDGDDWISPVVLIDNLKVRTRMTISWQTLRFTSTVEVIDKKAKPVKEGKKESGACEEVPRE